MKFICNLRQKVIKFGIFLPTRYLSCGFGTVITPLLPLPYSTPVNFVQ